jgi:hypothetical protein
LSTWIERMMHIEWRRLVPLAIVLGVLGASALLGMRATPTLVFLATAGMAGSVAFIWLTWHIEWGVLALVPITFLVPFGLGTGTYTTINLTILIALLLLGVWALRMLIFERKVWLVRSHANLPALLFLVAVALAFLAGDLPWLPFVTARASTFSQIGGVLMLVLPVGLMLLVGNIFRQEKWLRGLVWLFLGLGAIHLAALWLPGGGVISGLFVGKSVSSLFYTWSTALSGGMLLFNDELKGWKRGGVGLVLGLTLAAALGPARSSASSWVPALLVLAVLLALKWWRLGVLFGLAGGVALVLRYQQIYQVLFRTETYSAVTRAATWPIMYALVKASPLLGLGPSNYYFYTPHFSLLGYYVQFNSHNNYWDLAAQVGLLGLGLFLWMAIALGRSAWRIRTQAANGFQRGYVHAALAGLVGTLAAGMLADWFMPFVYNIGFDGFRGAAFAWLFLGGVVALEGLNKKHFATDEHR